MTPILANTITADSASACVAILILVGYLRANYPQWRITLAPYHDSLQLFAGFGSAALFLVAFTINAARSHPEGDATVSG